MESDGDTANGAPGNGDDMQFEEEPTAAGYNGQDSMMGMFTEFNIVDIAEVFCHFG